MDPNVKAKWVAALRSGEYKQGQGQLRYLCGEGYRHCCLGVLTDIAAREGVGRWGEYAFGTNEEADLSRKVYEWAGLDTRDPILGPPGNWATVLNDGGASFSEIADLIERYL